MKEWLRANRHRIERDLLNSPHRHLFSPALYSQYEVTLPLIRRFARGRLIDLGCGDMPFRESIIDQVSVYDGLDLHPCTWGTYIGNVEDMFMIGTESYDTAICLEVLEHVSDPFRAAREIYRILKPGGVLILSVPHLSRLHNEPDDYYRFTQHGVENLLERAGFNLVALEKRGGLLSFLGHQLSTLMLSIVWSIPVLKDVVWFLNSWFITRACYRVDRILDRSGLFAMGYTAVAYRKDHQGVVGNTHYE